MKYAVIFDVDGVLLELTRDEEEIFFASFSSRLDSNTLSRDWDSYKIRNDQDIIAEIVERGGLTGCEAQAIAQEYLTALDDALQNKLKSVPIKGAGAMLERLAALATLGIASANFHRAAELRLRQCAMWEHVSSFACGADGGGAKSAILARVVAALGLPNTQIIFIGDNVTDVEAGLANNTNFIGFSTSPLRRQKLRAAGAKYVCSTHIQTEKLVREILYASI